MDGGTFDRLTRLFAGAVTRRTGLAAALAGLAAGSTGLAEAKQRDRTVRAAEPREDVLDDETLDPEGACGKGRKNRCRRHKDCCTRYCKKIKGKGRRCRCIKKGRKCRKAQKCCKGLVCKGKRCVPVAPPAPACGASGATCASNAACCSGLVCQQGLCSPCGASGATCASSATCCSGLTCDQGACSSCGATGATCTSDATCCSGLVCQQGLCGPCVATVCASGCTFTDVNAAYGAASAGDTIYLDAGTYPTGIIVTKDITIAACPGVTAILEPDRLVKDSGDSYYVIMTEDTVDTTTKHAVTLRNLTLQGTPTGVSNDDEVLLASYQDGLISWTVDTCDLSKAYAGIYARMGDHVVTDSVFKDFPYAGVYQDNVELSQDPMSLTVTGSSFDNCDSYGIYFYPKDGSTVDAQMTVTDCTFTNCEYHAIYAEADGNPAIRANRKATITNSTLNAAAVKYEAIYVGGMTMEITGCTITNNTDTAINAYDTDLTIKDTIIEGNVSQGIVTANGGGVFISAETWNASLTVSGTTEIKGNSAKTGFNGGGIYAAQGTQSTVTVSGTTTANVTGNTPNNCYKFVDQNPGASGVKDCGTWT